MHTGLMEGDAFFAAKFFLTWTAPGLARLPILEVFTVKAKILVASIVMAGLVSPAFAATYYVVQNSKTHKCSVSTSKPSAKSKTSVLVGDAGYKTKKEATDAMAGATECKTST